MKSRDVLLVGLGAVLGAAIALLVRSGSGTTSPSADRSDESVAALQRQVDELKQRLAAQPPPPTLAAAPMSPDASGTRPAPPAMSEAVDLKNAEADPASLPLSMRSFGRLYEAAPGTPPPSAEEIPRLLESRESKDMLRAVREIGRRRLNDYLPALTDLVNRPEFVNRPERRGDAATITNTIANLKDRPWSPIQATGAPDTPIDGDLGTAWASKSPDMGIVTLDLEYDRAVRVDGVRVHETLSPGALARIEVKGPDGAWDPVWIGEERREQSPYWSEPKIVPTLYASNAIRLVLDTNRAPGWNEIDAVELLGDGLRQWAARASASSSYSDP